jgi:phosphopantothenoylcysteine synthetase/decarboxylase
MKIIVTSGATREYIDQVRFISNNSTGSLASLIAAYAAEQGFEVEYVHGVNAALPSTQGLINFHEIVSTEDLLSKIRELLSDTDSNAVIQPMAVSDFTPSEKGPGKIPSNTKPLSLTLVPTPKVIQEIKKIRPDITLISFKLETGITEDELISKAKKSLQTTGSIAVVANLLEHTGPDNHTAFLVCSDGTRNRHQGKNEIARAVIEFLRNSL